MCSASGCRPKMCSAIAPRLASLAAKTGNSVAALSISPTSASCQSRWGASRTMDTGPHQAGDGHADRGDVAPGLQVSPHLLDRLRGHRHRLLRRWGRSRWAVGPRRAPFAAEADQSDGDGVDFGIDGDGQCAVPRPHDGAGPAHLCGCVGLRLLDQSVPGQLLDEVLDGGPRQAGATGQVRTAQATVPVDEREHAGQVAPADVVGAGADPGAAAHGGPPLESVDTFPLTVAHDTSYVRDSEQIYSQGRPRDVRS